VTWKTSLDESDLYDIVESYAEGTGIVELARAYRVRTAAINEILARNLVPPRKTDTANTPIERRLHDALKVAGIGFTTQRRVAERYVADIVLHQAPVVIEADGARHRSGEAAIKRDEVRDAAHAVAGYRVFRFSGSQINADAMACVRQVIDACGLVPDTEPVFNIRTNFSGPDHPRFVRYELTCAHCGKTFQSKRQGRQYCSREHYYAGGLKGRPKSPEHRAKLAEASRRRTQSPETRAKISAAKAGTSLSAEHRAKISAGVRARQIKIESDLHGDVQRPAETTGPATLF
jgi:very-short-patch-repair endonuclease